MRSTRKRQCSTCGGPDETSTQKAGSKPRKKSFGGLNRSEIMSLIRSRGNKQTELALVALLRLNRITGWRRHPSLFGNPDFVFWKERVAVFVDGCFWHSCPQCYKRPASNRSFWDAKMRKNRKRDSTVTRKLCQAGWLVIRFWQHELRDGCAVTARLRRALGRVP